MRHIFLKLYHYEKNIQLTLSFYTEAVPGNRQPSNEVIYHTELAVEHLKTELIVIDAVAQVLHNLFDEKSEISYLENRALSHLKREISACKNKYHKKNLPDK